MCWTSWGSTQAIQAGRLRFVKKTLAVDDDNDDDDDDDYDDGDGDDGDDHNAWT